MTPAARPVNNLTCTHTLHLPLIALVTSEFRSGGKQREQWQSQLDANFIWGIADDILRDVYVRSKYRDVILPMTVIRRFDAVLEPTKSAVLAMKERLDGVGITHQDAALRQVSGQAFYNTSPFTLRDLRAGAKTQQLKADFEAYLDGFSPNV